MSSPSLIRGLSLPRQCVVLLINFTWMLNVPMAGQTPESQVLQYFASKDLPLLPSSQSYT